MAPGNSRAAVLHALTQHSICFSPISREKERGYFKAAFKYLHSKVTHAISAHISLDRASHMATWTWKRLGNGSLTWKGEPETLVSSTNGHHNAMSLQCPVINSDFKEFSIIYHTLFFFSFSYLLSFKNNFQAFIQVISSCSHLINVSFIPHLQGDKR